MAQTILDDGINVMGSTWDDPPVPEPGPITITTPSEGATVTAPITVSGTADPGQDISVSVSGHSADFGTVTADAEGNWTFTAPAWPDGITDAQSVTIIASYSGSGTAGATVHVTASVPAPPEPQAASTRLVQPDTIEPSNYTAAEVKHYLTQHPEDVPAVLTAERAGKNRASIIRAFEDKEN